MISSKSRGFKSLPSLATSSTTWNQVRIRKSKNKQENASKQNSHFFRSVMSMVMMRLPYSASCDIRVVFTIKASNKHDKCHGTSQNSWWIETQAKCFTSAQECLKMTSFLRLRRWSMERTTTKTINHSDRHSPWKEVKGLYNRIIEGLICNDWADIYDAVLA